MVITENPNSKNFSALVDKTANFRESDNLLLTGIIESFFDGILILSEAGEWVHYNHFASQICAKLAPNPNPPKSVPEVIWQVCLALIESRNIYPNQLVIMENEITIDKRTKLRIRVRWLQLNAITNPCLLVILEDRHQSIASQAIADIDLYKLTPREAEVWLLRQANYTYKEIAADLHISIDTVKKHMKNIYAKQDTAHYMERSDE